ncbi:uncharacterized protein SEPMUDRAFT_120126 [Sphaerulina musiva SO2202]|uniref:Uncharacterized protein n=1 Tax=Sphaerulina musiva (strain SO2202) TaxID=692275 RepID=N1QD99_SPHMS|nr:uncharacterized protein SEPMUDRAFT_120126 [Sphaerulina musiva SO2202]EMF09261.1 hypothetical protein SEPMUDRAFT_120126 [Sphaerulina musiva SO2202]
MPSAWKRWWRNNLNKLKKKNKNRPIFDRDFNDDQRGLRPTQQRPYTHSSVGGPPLPPGSTHVARDPFDRFGHSHPAPRHNRAASYSRVGRPRTSYSSDSSDSFRTAPQQDFKC